MLCDIDQHMLARVFLVLIQTGSEAGGGQCPAHRTQTKHQSTAMASSSSAPAQEHHVVLVLVFLVGGKPWSESAPGTTFDSWWRKEFQNEDLPVGLSSDATVLLNQQEEWVGAVSTRGGQDGTLKPREALSPAVAEAEWGDDPHGGKSGGVVKVVLRPMQSRNPGGKMSGWSAGRTHGAANRPAWLRCSKGLTYKLSREP